MFMYMFKSLIFFIFRFLIFFVLVFSLLVFVSTDHLDRVNGGPCGRPYGSSLHIKIAIVYFTDDCVFLFWSWGSVWSSVRIIPTTPKRNCLKYRWLRFFVLELGNRVVVRTDHPDQISGVRMVVHTDYPDKKRLNVIHLAFSFFHQITY